MDESSFETFEEEFGKPLQEVPPSKPVRQSRTGSRAEMYAQRRVREETPLVQQVPKIIPRDHPLSAATSLRKALSIQNLSPVEAPWDGVTLNRCLIVAVTILLLSSALQRIQDAVRGRKEDAEEIVALHERHALIKRGKITPQEPDSSLWDALFWWFDDDDDDDEGSGKPKRASRERVSRGLRHRALPDLRLLKKRKSTFTERRGRRDEIEERQKETKVKQKVEEKDEDKGQMKKPKKAAKDSKTKPEKKE